MRLIGLVVSGAYGLLRFVSKPVSVYPFLIVLCTLQSLYFDSLYAHARNYVARPCPQSDFYTALQWPLFVLLTLLLLYAARRVLMRRAAVNFVLLFLALSFWNYQERWIEIAIWGLRPYFPTLDRETFLFALMLIPGTVIAAILYRLFSKLVAILLYMFAPPSDEVLALRASEGKGHTSIEPLSGLGEDLSILNAAFPG